MEKEFARFLEMIFHHIFLAVKAALHHVNEPLTLVSNQMIDRFETALPQQVGRIRRTPADLLVFVLYLFALGAGLCYLMAEILIVLRRKRRRIPRCRCRKKSNEPLLYRQEVPSSQGPVTFARTMSQTAPAGRPCLRPSWLDREAELADKPIRQTRQTVCCFDLLGSF